MTPDELNELKEGKKWNNDLILKAKDIHVPSEFYYLKRRIQQLRCATLQKAEATRSLRSRLIIRYILGAGYIVTLLGKSTISGKKIESPFSIWDSDIDPHVASEVFNDFINSKQIVNLDLEKFIFVKSGTSKNETHFHSCLYTPNPIYDTLKHLKLSSLDCIGVIAGMIKNFFLYLKISSNCIGAEGLFKDFLIEPLINLYKKKGLVKFYRTNSDINIQEFWCEKIDFNTVWYSINTRAIQYINSPIGPYPEYTFFYVMYNGTSWTWNTAHAKWLQQFNDHKTNAVGPIIFYSPTKKQSSENISRTKRILVFDIAPFYISHLKEHIGQRGLNYYNESTCIKFISDILEASEKENWQIFLKPKRKYSDMHNKKYINFLKHSEIQHTRFKILSPTSNIYDEILNSDIVISIPFTSPFDIAKSLNISALYYDPSGEVDFQEMGYNCEDYANNVSTLKTKISPQEGS